MSEHKWANSTIPKTCQMVEAWGLDPMWISLDGVTREGYFYMQHDEDGNRILNSDSTTFSEWREWPTAEAGDMIYQLYMKEITRGK